MSESVFWNWILILQEAVFCGHSGVRVSCGHLRLLAVASDRIFENQIPLVLRAQCFMLHSFPFIFFSCCMHVLSFSLLHIPFMSIFNVHSFPFIVHLHAFLFDFAFISFRFPTRVMEGVYGMAWPGDRVQQMVIAMLLLGLSLNHIYNISHCPKMFEGHFLQKERGERERERGTKRQRDRETLCLCFSLFFFVSPSLCPPLSLCLSVSLSLSLFVRKTERNRDRETERNRDRETEKQGDRETERQGEREKESELEAK